MAFRSNGPVTLSLPAFRGVTRQIILVCIVSFFASLLLASFVPPAGNWLVTHMTLLPARVFQGWIWQLLTYAFFPMGLIGELFALLSVWFIGSMLEDQLGSRWLREYFFATVIGGGLLASVAAFFSHGRLFGIHAFQPAAGLWPFVMALLLAFARYNAEQEIVLLFALRLRAKYLTAIYLLYYLGSTMLGGDRFGALTALCAALAGWLYLRFVPRGGLGLSASEGWYGLRNEFYRGERRRAARKFKVYMREQGRDVDFDADGKYVDKDLRDPHHPDNPHDPRNPNDRRWMN